MYGGAGGQSVDGGGGSSQAVEYAVPTNGASGRFRDPADFEDPADFGTRMLSFVAGAATAMDTES